MILKCEICGREFERYDKKRSCRGGRVRICRPYKSVTCSKQCSRKRMWLHSGPNGLKRKNIKNETIVKDGRRI